MEPNLEARAIWIKREIHKPVVALRMMSLSAPREMIAKFYSAIEGGKNCGAQYQSLPVLLLRNVLK